MASLEQNTLIFTMVPFQCNYRIFIIAIFNQIHDSFVNNNQTYNIYVIKF